MQPQILKTICYGIIMSNHESWTFSDYLPLLAALWDGILKKTIFYTGSYNLSMNRKESPEYEFRSAALRTKNDVAILADQVTKDIKKMTEEWWNIL